MIAGAADDLPAHAQLVGGTVAPWTTHCRDEFTADPTKFTGRHGVQADATGQGQTGTFSPGPHRPDIRQ